MVIENRPFGVRTSVIIEAKTLRCQNINKLIYFDGKTDLTQTREKITCVRGNQAGINAFLVPHELQYATVVQTPATAVYSYLQTWKYIPPSRRL